MNNSIAIFDLSAAEQRKRLLGMLACTLMAAMPALGLEINVQADSFNPATKFWIEVTYIPHIEPIGGMELALQIAPDLNVSSINLTPPEKGAWSQIKPELLRTGNTMKIHAISPALLTSKNSNQTSIMKIQLDLAESRNISQVWDVISNTQVIKAINTAGEELSGAPITLKGITTIKGAGRDKSRQPEVSYRSISRKHTFSFNLAKKVKVKFQVRDSKGNMIVNLLDEILPAGIHSVSWSGGNREGGSVPTGIYFMQIEIKTSVYNKKVRHVQ